MPQDDGFPAVNPSVPAVDIPDLKKQEKERKKSGIAWGGAATEGAKFVGARAGAAAAAAPAVSKVGTAFFATMLGKAALAGGAALVLGGSGLYMVASRQGPASKGAALGDISSTIKVRKAAAKDSLNFAAEAAKGQLNFEASKKPEAAKPQEEAPAEKADTPETNADFAGGTIQNVQQELQKERLAHNLSGAKLSTSFGGNFGKKDIFAGAGALKFGQGFDRSKIAVMEKGRGGTSRGMAKATAARRVGQTTRSNVNSRRALGQLKNARVLSRAAAGGTGEASKTLASDAFDGNVTQGGDAKIGLTDQPTTVNPLEGSGGAPDLTQPDTVAGTDQTPYKPQLQQAMNLGNQAGQMKNMAMVMIAIGTICLIIAAFYKSSVIGAKLGLILLIMGLLFIAMGAMMMSQASSMADKAKALGNNLGQQYGQTAQAQIINECVDQSINNGATMETCKPTTQGPSFSSTIKEDIEREQNASDELNTGRPIGVDAPTNP